MKNTIQCWLIYDTNAKFFIVNMEGFGPTDKDEKWLKSLLTFENEESANLYINTEVTNKFYLQAIKCNVTIEPC